MNASKIHAPIVVNFVSTHWFRDLNYRKSIESFGDPLADVAYRYETDKTTGLEKLIGGGDAAKKPLVRLLEGGWKKEIVVASRATKAEQEAAIAERRVIIAEYKAVEKTAALASTLEEIWFPDGKPVSVDWVGKDCYRRSTAIPGVLHRRRMAKVGADWDRVYAISLVPTEYAPGKAGELAALHDHLGENLIKTAGRMELAPADYFFAVRRWLELEPTLTEAQVRRLPGFKVGEAQRSYALARLDRDFPTMKIYERIENFAKPNADNVGKRLDVSKFSHADLVRFRSGRLPGTKGDDASTTVPAGKNAQIRVLEEFFADRMSGAAGTAMTIKEVVDLANKSETYLLCLVSKMLADPSRKAFVSSVDKYAAEINKALEFLRKKIPAYDAIAKANEPVAEDE